MNDAAPVNGTPRERHSARLAPTSQMTITQATTDPQEVTAMATTTTKTKPASSMKELEAHPNGLRLTSKVALITGGARGMGASFAKAMVAQGANVMITDVRDDAGNQLARSLGKQAAYRRLDVTHRDDWKAAVQETIRTFGKLNVLVNNAGIVNFAPIDHNDQDNWDHTIAVDLTGAYNGIHASVEALKKYAPASIINISSTAGMRGYRSLTAYSAAKFGLRGLTKSVALDLAAMKVRCNSVHPGPINTPMLAGHEDAKDQVAMKRVGQPYEIANLVVFLASDESSFSTGAEFVADGGELAGLAPS
jgi:3alpha(or 20beta)-hydroxysteroid dehydrogenase